MPARLAATLLAALTWTALLLQLVLSLRLSLAAGEGPGHGLVMYLGYFTVLSNLLLALVATRGARSAHGGLDDAWRGCATTAIVVVGIGYHLLLRHAWNPQGAQWLADVLLHYVVPAAALAWWLFLPPKAGVPGRAPLQWLAWPLAYLVYALVRGALLSHYPYFFIDPATLGLPRVLANAAGLMLAFLATGYVLRAAANVRR